MVAPLEGLKVVELGDDGGGEWLGRLLAGLGAEVTKVEPPEGCASRRIGPFAQGFDGPDASLYFWHFNAGKRSVTLDLESDAGRTTVRSMIDAADVFIDAMPPGEALRRGLDYATLSQANPCLIQVAVSPFGQDGPYIDAGLHTTDLVTLALGGTLQACGYDPGDELPPMRPGPYHAHYAAGHYASVATLAAVWEQGVSGQGRYIDVSAQAALAVTNEFSNLQWEYAQLPVRRQTGRHAFVRPPTVPMQIACADGFLNIMLPRDERTWQRLVDFLHERGLGTGLNEAIMADASRRMERSALAMEDLQVIAAGMAAEEMFHLGQSMGMTWGAVRAPEAWLHDPHAEARAIFTEVYQPQIGRSVPVAVPIKFGATPMRVERAPLLGEHTGK